MKFATLHLRAVQQFKEKRLVTRSAFDDDNALAQRPLQARKRFSARLAVGDDLGHHSRAGQNSEPLNQARSRSKAMVRVFRIQPHLNGMTDGARGFAFQAATARYVDLKFYEIEAGRAFGDRMFNLQPGVHLHE